MAKFKVTMSKDKTATLFIYEGIYWGLAQEFADELQRLKNDGAEKFIVRINSPGGSAYDGLAICNLLKSYDAMVVVDSMAASAASLIAMGAKTIKNARNVANACTRCSRHDLWQYKGSRKSQGEH